MRFAVLTILPAALWAQDERPRLAPQFEPSYVVFGPWSPHHPDTTLFFEANIAPAFYVSLTDGFAVVATPRVILRQVAEGSGPVKTPSYMPRLAAYRWWRRGDDADFPLADIQPPFERARGEHRSAATGRLNHQNGNFSTNFLDFTWQRSARVRGMEATVRGSVEWHVPGTYDPDEMREYSKLWFYPSTEIAVSRPQTGGTNGRRG